MADGSNVQKPQSAWSCVELRGARRTPDQARRSLWGLQAESQWIPIWIWTHPSTRPRPDVAPNASTLSLLVKISNLPSLNHVKPCQDAARDPTSASVLRDGARAREMSSVPANRSPLLPGRSSARHSAGFVMLGHREEAIREASRPRTPGHAAARSPPSPPRETCRGGAIPPTPLVPSHRRVCVRLLGLPAGEAAPVATW